MLKCKYFFLVGDKSIIICLFSHCMVQGHNNLTLSQDLTQCTSEFPYKTGSPSHYRWHSKLLAKSDTRPQHWDIQSASTSMIGLLTVILWIVPKSFSFVWYRATILGYQVRISLNDWLAYNHIMDIVQSYLLSLTQGCNSGISNDFIFSV